jgi:hypothetical protein
VHIEVPTPSELAQEIGVSNTESVQKSTVGNQRTNSANIVNLGSDPVPHRSKNYEFIKHAERVLKQYSKKTVS